MAYVIIKYTAWEGYHIKDESNIDAIISGLKQSIIPDQFLEEVGVYMGEADSPREYLTPKENQAATIEIYNDNDELIWKNMEDM